MTRRWISAKHSMRMDTVLYCFGKVQQGIRLYLTIILLILVTVTTDMKGTMCCSFLPRGQRRNIFPEYKERSARRPLPCDTHSWIRCHHTLPWRCSPGLRRREISQKVMKVSEESVAYIWYTRSLLTTYRGVKFCAWRNLLPQSSIRCRHASSFVEILHLLVHPEHKAIYFQKFGIQVQNLNLYNQENLDLKSQCYGKRRVLHFLAMAL